MNEALGHYQSAIAIANKLLASGQLEEARASLLRETVEYLTETVATFSEDQRSLNSLQEVMNTSEGADGVTTTIGFGSSSSSSSSSSLLLESLRVEGRHVSCVVVPSCAWHTTHNGTVATAKQNNTRHAPGLRVVCVTIVKVCHSCHDVLVFFCL